MNKTQLEITAQMLSIASDEFGNHVCNDLMLPNTPDNLKFVREMIDEYSDEKDEAPNVSKDGRFIYVFDWMVMGYCKALLLREAQKL